PRARAILTVLLQEVVRVAAAVGLRPRPRRPWEGRRHVYRLRSHPTFTVHAGATHETRLEDADSIGRRHVDFPALPGKVLADLVDEDAQEKEADGGYDQEEQDRQRVESTQGRVHRHRRGDE